MPARRRQASPVEVSNRMRADFAYLSWYAEKPVYNNSAYANLPLYGIILYMLLAKGQ